MLRRYRSGIPALLVTGVYAVGVVVAGVVALTTGAPGLLWRLTLFVEADDGITATSPNVLVPVLTGMAWAWALWVSLRGPLAGPRPELDRDTGRLRVALYVVAALSLLVPLLPSWPWWATVVNVLIGGMLVVLFPPVLGRNLEHAGFAWAAGVLGYGGLAVVEVLDAIGWSAPDWLSLTCALAAWVWMVLVLRAQRWDGRWRRATVRYGIAGMVAPVVAMLVNGMLASVEEVLLYATGATGALMVIWAARSGHELADPRPQPAPPEPLPSGPLPSGPLPSGPLPSGPPAP
ncbi:hypothetical protein [Nonomuraea sp. NPDC050691]|uniref:hypothetical protein n=1 Tax=Nonomuraea sp. NPDC050691 TaxID=3155661 RepID=UPI0033CFA724